jgi:hypothetical protein
MVWSFENLTDLMANFTYSVSFLIAPALNTSSMSILQMESEAIINTISLKMNTKNNNFNITTRSYIRILYKFN